MWNPSGSLDTCTHSYCLRNDFSQTWTLGNVQTLFSRVCLSHKERSRRLSNSDTFTTTGECPENGNPFFLLFTAHQHQNRPHHQKLSTLVPFPIETFHRSLLQNILGLLSCVTNFINSLTRLLWKFPTVSCCTSSWAHRLSPYELAKGKVSENVVSNWLGHLRSLTYSPSGRCLEFSAGLKAALF